MFKVRHCHLNFFILVFWAWHDHFTNLCIQEFKFINVYWNIQCILYYLNNYSENAKIGIVNKKMAVLKKIVCWRYVSHYSTKCV